MAPEPISWPPSSQWDGDDGSWSSFFLEVGSPGQLFRVLPSTAGQETWVVSPLGCPPGRNGTSTSLTCDRSRGGLFDTAQSSSWAFIGNHSLGGNDSGGLEASLGYSETALYGFDTITLDDSFLNRLNDCTIKSQVVASFATEDDYVGVFGLSVENSAISNDSTSFLYAMWNESLIPSWSWAYTAGASYRTTRGVKGVLGSLTFGGYDPSLFVPNDVSIAMTAGGLRDLGVGLQAITLSTMNESTVKRGSLLPVPILTFVDSTLPYIYLPVEACHRFEETLGLYWDETAEMYWVNDTLHQALLSSNLDFTLTIGSDTIAGGPTVQIVLPYASFDLEVNYPFKEDTTRYFPLKRAAKASQYTLGRTLLQEAYIITDYERRNFSISQCLFADDKSMALVAIPSTTKMRSHIRRNVAMGASIGAVNFLLLIFIGTFLFIRRKRKRRTNGHAVNDAQGPPTLSCDPRALSLNSRPREIDHNSVVGPVRELPNTVIVELLDDHFPTGSGNEISEVSDISAPVAHELRTHGTSQVMVHTSTPNPCKIFKSTKISRKSWTSVASSDGAPRVETVISALAQERDPDTDGTSVVIPNLLAEIYSSCMRKSLNLDRSLPSTPISESP